jgi:hypothetical protein
MEISRGELRIPQCMCNIASDTMRVLYESSIVICVI